MKKGDFVSKVRAKYPAYKDVPDDELFVRMSKHYPSYIQNDEELKKDFLDLANQNEDYGSGVVKLDPEKAYNLITSIPEYKPPRSEYLEFGKHDPDVDWGEAGSAAVSYLGNMVAEGFSWDEEANMAGTVVEGGMQGTRALYGMLGESTDPNSVFFKGRALMGSLLNPTGGDDAGYKQWLAARDFAQQTLRYEEGKDQILPDSISVNRKAAVALGLGLDPSLFVSFGAGTIGKLATKGAAAGLRGAGKAAKSVGKAVAMPMEKAMTAASEAITKAVPGVPEQTVRGTAIAATGMGAVATPIGQTVSGVYGAAKGAETLGDIALGVGEQMGKQPTRMGVFAGMAADPTKTKLTRGVSRAASVLGGDTALTAAGAATRGAFEGGVVGAGLGYGTAREQGAAGGLAGGAAFGVVGGTAGAAFRSLSGTQRKRAIGADFGRFLEGVKERSDAEVLAVSSFVGGDLNRAATIMDLHDFAKGSSGEDVAVKFLNNEAFKEMSEGQSARGAMLVRGDKPEIFINTDWRGKGSHSMAHEVFHAVGQLDGMGAYKGRLKDAIMGVRGSGDEVLRPGLLNESQLRDLATQYANKLNKQSRGEWMENWRDNTIEELSAEAFATLITGSKPDALLAGKGFDTLTRRALDRLILADAESRIGMMRNAVTRAFGVEFDPVVKEPTDSVAFKDARGNPLRNHSPAVNAILRDMVRAKRAIADHHALDNKLVSKNLVRTRGLSNKEMAKFQEQFKDNPMSELFTVDKKGKVKMVKGSEAGAIEKETSNKIVDAIESAVDTGDALHVRKQVGADGKVEYSGLKFSKEQMDAINKTDIHPRIKEFLNLMQESLGDGRLFDTEYWAATRRDRNGQPVYASLKATRRNVVPYSINISREGNFYARALDITALDKKFRQWKNRNTEWIRHWDNPNKFYEDAMKYLQNLASGNRVESAKLFGETKRNILNEFIGARGRTGLNPLALEKMAEKEFLIRSFRLDRIASMHLDNSQKRFPFSEEVYRLNQANFLPEPVGLEKDKATGKVIRQAKKDISLSSKKHPESVRLKLKQNKDGTTKIFKEKDDDGNFLNYRVEFEQVPYSLLKSPKIKHLKTHEAKVEKAAQLLEVEAKKLLQIPEVAAGNGWYSRMRSLLQRTFGATIEVFGQLLGATSARTPVDTNFKQALEALTLSGRGHYDGLLARFHKHVEGVMAKRDSGALEAEWKAKGGKGKFDESKAHRQAINLFKEVPLRENGKKYNANSTKVLHTIYGNWLEMTQGPKTPNFAGNITGRTFEATIDVWAARTLRRILYEGNGGTKKWRILPRQEKGVDHTTNAAGKLGGDFPFGQDVFKVVAQKLGMSPDDLQAVIWFGEKGVWEERGWTGKIGAEKSSFDKEAGKLDLNRYQLGVTTFTEPKEFSLARQEQEKQSLRGVIGRTEGMVASRVTHSEGLYANSPEPTIDAEFSLAKGSDPTPIVQEMIRVGSDNNQIDVFASLVVDATHPNARPMVEVGFKSPASKAEVESVMKTFRDNGVDGFTLAKSDRGETIGIRSQYVPEISARYGSKESLQEKTFLQESKAWMASAMSALNLAGKSDNISYGEKGYVSTNVYGKEEYKSARAQDPRRSGRADELGRRSLLLDAQLLPESDGGQVLRGDSPDSATFREGLSDANRPRPPNERRGVKFLPEELGPNTEQLAVALQEGAISRQQWDTVVELMNPIAKEVQTPTNEAVDFKGNYERMVAALQGSKGKWKDKIEKLGAQLELMEGSDVGLRIDIPAYLKSLELVEQGLLSEPVYIISFHAGTKSKDKSKGRLGSPVGYDIVGRATDVVFNIASQVAALNIAGGKAKTTIATAEGKLSHDRTIPADIDTNYIQIGMNPKRHGYFYDRATGRAVKSAGEVISYGSTVFARKTLPNGKKDPKLKFYTETEKLDLFSYLPEKVGDSEVRTTEEGYKSIKRDSKIRVYTPKGKLIGVASSAKVANQLYRRHIKSNESRKNNIRQ
jgi:hypothetical protein